VEPLAIETSLIHALRGHVHQGCSLTFAKTGMKTGSTDLATVTVHSSVITVHLTYRNSGRFF
jgi:hypothetical protein